MHTYILFLEAVEIVVSEWAPYLSAYEIRRIIFSSPEKSQGRKYDPVGKKGGKGYFSSEKYHHVVSDPPDIVSCCHSLVLLFHHIGENNILPKRNKQEMTVLR